MDIKHVSLSGSAPVAPEAGARAPVAKDPGPQSWTQDAGTAAVNGADALEAVARKIAEAIMAVDGANLPRNLAVRGELDIDDASRRVFARLVNRDTGEIVRQYPPDETLRLLAKTREQFGQILRTDV